MQRETTVIGTKEYAFSKISAFKANSLLLKIQKIVLPLVGEVTNGKQSVASVMDLDISKALEILSSKLDDDVMTDIILPMLKEAQVACTTDKIKIDSAIAIDKVFVDADGLADLYVLIFEVLKYNFNSFFMNLVNAFGSSVGDKKAQSTLAE